MGLTEVKFIVGKDGSIRMDVLNGEGESCVIATQELELSLSNAGSQKVDEGKKPEFYSGPGLSIFNDLTGDN